MSQLNVKLAPDRLEALRRYAAQRRTPVAWLIKDYVEYLLAGGRPVTPPAYAEPSTIQMAGLAEASGGLSWLREEPELYTTGDSEAL